MPNGLHSFPKTKKIRFTQSLPAAGRPQRRQAAKELTLCSSTRKVGRQGVFNFVSARRGGFLREYIFQKLLLAKPLRVFNFASLRLGEIKKQKSPSKSLLKGILCGPTWNRTKHLLPRRIGGVSCSVLSIDD